MSESNPVPTPASPGESAPTPSSDTAQNATGAAAPVAATPEGASAVQTNAGGEAKAQESQPAKVEDFALAFPEGVQGEPAFATSMTEIAKKSGLNKAQAEKVFGGLLGIMSEQAQAFAKQEAAWAEEVKNDKEIGGPNLEKNLAIAKRAAEQLGEGFAQLLQAPGLGNRPEVIKAMVKVGKMLSEDSIAGTAQKSEVVDQNAWLKQMYPNSPELWKK